eukprot:SAG31_NODE_412_length_15972_cov_3.590626_3_plen_62_part_00
MSRKMAKQNTDTMCKTKVLLIQSLLTPRSSRALPARRGAAISNYRTVFWYQLKYTKFSTMR